MKVIRVPGDKSISHRALMLAPLAEGRSRLWGLSRGDDVQRTAEAMRALGVPWRAIPEGEEPLEVEGPISLTLPARVLDCGNSGTTARLLLGLVAGVPIQAVLDGDESLRRRPMSRVTDPLREAGAEVRELDEPGYLPVEVSGGDLRAIEHRSPIASAQVKSALLLAGLGSRVPVAVTEPGASRDHTERMLRTMGVSVSVGSEDSGQKIRMEPPTTPLQPLDLRVPGDLSSASFFLALALLGGCCESGLRVEGVGLNPGRSGLVPILQRMGGRLDLVVSGHVGGEPFGTVSAHPSSLTGVTVPARMVPSFLDEIPALACIAVRARGVTLIHGAAELRVKESDRLALLAANLSSLGVVVEERPDGLQIEGTDRALEGAVVTEGDHRIAMAFAVLGALPGNRIELDDPGCVEVSYPGFWGDLARCTGRS